MAESSDADDEVVGNWKLEIGYWILDIGYYHVKFLRTPTSNIKVMYFHNESIILLKSPLSTGKINFLNA